MTISATTQGIKPGVCLSTNRPVNPFDGQVIYMTDVDQTAVWDGSQWTVLAPITGGRNAIINGAMNVWQRGTSSGTLGVGGGSYVGPDRWWFYNNGFTSTISQQLCGSTLPQFRNCARIQRTSGQTGTAALVLNSPQETVNSVRLAGKTVTLSFYARASSGVSSFTSLRLSLRTGTGVDQNNLGGGAYTGLATPISFVPTLTTSWQRFSGSASVDSTATELSVEMQFVPTGTAGASDYVEITGIQLEEGSVATPFEFEDYGTTLAKCQRYFQSYTSSRYDLYSQRSGDEVKSATLQFITTLRTTPTVTLTSTSTDGGPSFTVQSYPHASRVSVTSTSSGQAPYIESWTASAEL